MNINSILITFILSGYLISPAHARLEENDTQIRQRYGEPQRARKIDATSQELTFHQNGWLITATMLNGYCHHIDYFMPSLKGSYEDVRNQLLAANNAGVVWKPAEKPKGEYTAKEYFVRSDNRGFALFRNDSGPFRAVFYSDQWLAREQRLKEEKNKPQPLPNF